MIVLPAYAKLNLTLEVVGRNPLGWHDLSACIIHLSLHDLVALDHREHLSDGNLVTASQSHGHDGVRIVGPQAAGVPTGADNLAVLAARRERHEGHGFDVDWIYKRIWSKAGLGGGSADAAAVLQGRIAEGLVSEADASLIAEELGSDIEICRAGGTGVEMAGKGDVIGHLPFPTMWVALLQGPCVSTAEVFGRLTPHSFSDGTRTRRYIARVIAGGDPQEDAGSALEDAACECEPALRTLVHEMRQDAPWAMTGSGGTLFYAARGKEQCEEVAAKARSRGGKVTIVQSLSLPQEPVAVVFRSPEQITSHPGASEIPL